MFALQAAGHAGRFQTLTDMSISKYDCVTLFISRWIRAETAEDPVEFKPLKGRDAQTGCLKASVDKSHKDENVYAV